MHLHLTGSLPTRKVIRVPTIYGLNAYMNNAQIIPQFYVRNLIFFGDEQSFANIIFSLSMAIAGP